MASDMAAWSASLCSAAWASALADLSRADSSPANSKAEDFKHWLRNEAESNLKTTKTHLRLGHAAPRMRLGPRLGLPQGLRPEQTPRLTGLQEPQPDFQPRRPNPEIGPARR
jgi:hypothetical protein